MTISVDDSLESIRSGSAGIVVSLPKQKNLSYLLKFSNQEGKIYFSSLFSFVHSCSDAISFNKLLGSVKAGKGFDDSEASQFDERTEESSAQQYFQVYFNLT